MRSILITGVSASGKSTLAEQAARALRIDRYDYADLMLKAAHDLGGKDAVEHLTWSERAAIYAKTRDLLTEWFGPSNSDDSTVLLENHLSIIQGGEVVTFPRADYGAYAARALIDIAADPRAVLERRSADVSRVRRVGSALEIARQQATNHEQAELVAEFLGVPVLHLDNHDAGAASRILTRWIEDLSA